MKFSNKKGEEPQDIRRNSSNFINKPIENKQNYQPVEHSRPVASQKNYQYDFLSNRVVIKDSNEKNPRANFFKNSLKNMFQDNNPVIFNHNLQNNELNDNVNSRKKNIAGLENDYCEIPKKYQFYQY